MRELISTITGKGQVTIPKTIRRQLGVERSDKVAFILHDSGLIELRPARYTLESLRGIIPALPGRETEDFDDLIAEAMLASADRIEALDDE